MRRRRIQQAEGACAESRIVHCPLDQAIRSLEHCASCRRFRGLSLERKGARIECRVPQAVLGPGPQPGQGLREALECVSVAELECDDLHCLAPELSAEDAVRLFQAHRLSQVPVVDDRGVLLGTVSARKLAAVPGSLEVEDAMSAPELKLRLTDSLARALTLVAQSGEDPVPVVTAEGELVGLVSAADLVRWLERAAGTLSVSRSGG